LELVPGSLSPRLLDGVARLGSRLSFAQAAELVRFFWGVLVSDDTVRRATERAGAALVAAEEAELGQVEREFAAPPPGPAVAQWSMDGAFVPLRHGQWAEVKLATVGTVTTRPGRAGEREAHAQDLCYFARLADAATFGRQVRLLVQRRGVQTAGVVAAVSDGAPWIQGIVDTYRPDAVRILDFPHALAHVATAAQATFADPAVLAAWLEEQAHALKHDGPDPVLAALRALPTGDAPDPSAAAEARAATLDYLEARRLMLRYPVFAAQGYPLGSGAVESACKLVVEARLKGRGMHWQAANVSPLLALRASAGSGRWTQDWPTILRQLRRAEQERRHQRRLARHPSAHVPARAPARARVQLSRARERLRAQEPPKIVAGRPTPDHPWRRPLYARPSKQQAS
jgi:hypothetical protein